MDIKKKYFKWRYNVWLNRWRKWKGGPDGLKRLQGLHRKLEKYEKLLGKSDVYYKMKRIKMC